MLSISNTENFAGVRISGDYWDFEELRQAFQRVSDHTLASDTYPLALSKRLQNLCLQLQNTRNGDFNIETTFNGINAKIKTDYFTEFPYENIYFSSEILWPEILFFNICLNELLHNIVESSRSNLRQPYMLTLQRFQAYLFQCMVATTTLDERKEMEKLFYMRKQKLHEYTFQYIDFLNLHFIKLSKKQRLIKRPSLLLKLVEVDNEYISFKNTIKKQAEKSNLPVHMVTVETSHSATIIW